ncbi:MAG: hypothetical protein FWE35_09660 [Streptosporangiales bacterium]|jgi:hypothetical protein|nr:hypothetical protein [Streptosporangiales bacterium]
MRHTDERHAVLRDVRCDRCRAVVQVAKFSPQHTSVQWTSEAAGRCAEFAERQAEATSRVRVASCGSLRETIDRAVGDGRLAVSASDGEAP